MSRDDWVAALFAPGSVALVGASDDRTKATSRPLDFLRGFAFPGRVYPVNPGRETVLGEPAWTSLEALPEVPDHVFLLTDRDRAIDQLDLCARLGVKVATILAGGFSDGGAEGAGLETRLRRLCEDTDLRLLGPNSLGVVNLHASMRLTGNAALREPDLTPGGTMVLSQSGSMLGALVSRGSDRGLRFSRLVSVGNEVDLNIGTIGLAAVDDPEVDCFVLFLETIRGSGDLLAFAEAADRAGKPVVAYKLGRSREAQELAVTHTGAILGEDDAADALFRAAGIARVDSLDGLIETVPLMAARRGRAPADARRPAVGVVATTGGGGAMAVDRMAVAGLEVIPPSGATWAALQHLGIAGSGERLVDLTLAGTRYEKIRSALEIMAAAPEFDIVVFAVGSSARFDPDLSIAPVVDAAASPDVAGKIAVFVVPEAPKALSRLAEAGIPSFRSPESCADALHAILTRRAPKLGLSGRRPPVSAPSDAGVRTLDEAASYDLLDQLGVPTPPRVIVEADSALTGLPFDYPVAAKLLSDRITHKSDIGGVVLDIENETALRQAIGQIRRAAAAQIGAEGGGQVLVTSMVAAVGEVMISYRVDEQVGPLILIAPGGTAVELGGQRCVRLAPVGPEEAMEMIESLEALRVLSGFRGRAAGDLAALGRAITALSELASLGRGIVEVEINPLRVGAEGQGVVAVDAVVRQDSGP